MKKNNEQHFFFIDYLRINFSEPEALDFLSMRMVDWLRLEIGPDQESFLEVVEWKGPHDIVSEDRADSSLVKETLKRHLVRLGINYLAYLQTVFSRFMKYYLFGRPSGDQDETEELYEYRKLIEKCLQDMNERILYDHILNKFKKVRSLGMIYGSLIRPDYDENDILWGLKTIMSYDLARFCLEEENLKRLHNCGFCKKYFVSKTQGIAKYCSDRCRLSHHNLERKKLGLHAEYMRMARKKGRRGPRGGIYF